MTVQSQISSITYTGDGNTTTFAYPFRILVNTDLKIVFTLNNVTTVKVLNVDYTVTNVDNPTGGNVIFTTAPPLNTSVYIARINMLYLQLMSFLPNSMFDLASLEEQLDRFALQDQQLDLKFSGSLVFPNNKLPANRANKILCFDSNGNLAVTINTPNTNLGFDSNGIIVYKVDPFVNLPANRANKLLYFDSQLNAQVTINTPNTVLGFDTNGIINYQQNPLSTLPINRQNKLPYFDSTGNPQVTSNIPNTLLGFDTNGVISYLTPPTAPSGMFTQSGIGAVPWTFQNKDREQFSVKDFGAIGDGVTDDTVAIQNAINACPIGGELLFNGRFIITNELVINKQITIKGNSLQNPYNPVNNCYIKQTTQTKSIFKLIAIDTLNTGNFAIYGSIFKNITLMGVSETNGCVSAIYTDTTVNSGNYVINNCVFENLTILYCQIGINLIGISYHNKFNNVWFYKCSSISCNLAFGSSTILSVNAPNLFYGCKIEQSLIGVSLYEDSSGTIVVGKNSEFYGCYFSTCGNAIKIKTSNALLVNGCFFENNTNGINIAYPNNISNVDSFFNISIINNQFKGNGVSITIDKSSVNTNNIVGIFSGNIDNNYFNDASYAINLITQNANDKGLIANSLVFGRANTSIQGYIPNTLIHPKIFLNDNRNKTYKKYIAITASNQIIEGIPNNAYSFEFGFYLTTKPTSSTPFQFTFQTLNNATPVAIGPVVDLFSSSYTLGTYYPVFGQAFSANGFILSEVLSQGLNGAVFTVIIYYTTN